MAEVEMLAATPGERFDSAWYKAVVGFNGGERLVPAVARIDVEHHEPGDGPGDDAHIGPGPSSPPAPDLLGTGGIAHVSLPGDV